MTNTTSKFNARNGLTVGSPPVDVVSAIGDISITGNVTAYNITSTGTVTLSGSLVAPGTMTAGSGFIGTASNATSIYGGISGAIPYQTAANTTAFSPAGTAGYALISGGSAAPSWSFLNSIPLVAPGGYNLVATAAKQCPGNVMGEIYNFRIGQTGTYTFGTYVYSNAHWMYAQIYKNGVAYGPFHTLVGGGAGNVRTATYYDNLAFNLGDTVQIFGENVQGGDYPYTERLTFYIYADNHSILVGPSALGIGVRL